MSRPRIPEAGFFVYIASWPWALTYHLFATRGSRGGLALLSFTALHVVTYLLAAAPLSIRWVPVSAKVSDDHQSNFGIQPTAFGRG